MTTPQIETDSLAKEYYQKHFQKNNSDTIFLNGKWGSGKTTFIDKVFKDSKNLRVKTIDLWRKPNNLDDVQTIYNSIFKYSYIVSKFFLILISLIIITVSLVTSWLDLFEDFSIIVFFLGLLISVNTYLLRINWESFYFSLLKLRINFIRKKLILIIDDFDRLSPNSQEILFKIFNTLQSKRIQFVFIGDINIIIKSDSNYLQKIIQQRLELPYTLSPSNIWSIYFNNLTVKINESRSLQLSNSEKESIEELFSFAVKENRVIRELLIYHRLVNQSIFEKNMVDKININQKLILIYMYAFHYPIYQTFEFYIDYLIKEHYGLSFSKALNLNNNNEEEDPFKITLAESLKLNDNNLLYFFEILFNEKDATHATLLSSPENYLINFSSHHEGSNKLIDLIENYEHDKLRDLPSFLFDDFFSFLKRNYDNLTDHQQNNLDMFLYNILAKGEDIKPFFYKNYKYSNDLKYIVSVILKKGKLKNKMPQQISKQIFDSTLFSNLDYSIKIRLLYYYYHMELPKIAEEIGDLSEMISSTEEILSYKHPSIVLSMYAECLFKKESSFLISTFHNLSDREFLFFLYYISNQRNNDSEFLIYIQEEKIKSILENRFSSLDESSLSCKFSFKLKSN